MRDYNAEFQQLINDALRDGWTPIWIDRVEGNDCYLGSGDVASEWFLFIKEEEQ